jgi:TolB-like protein
VVLVGAIVSVSLFFLGRYTAEPKSGASVNLTNRSVAVLPFENLSNDPENVYFSEGVQDEILTRLAKIAELKVVSKTSTQGLKSTPSDLPQIAHQLGVTNILEGSVQKAGDQVRVNVQLINAMTNAHLWAESYDRKLTDIFAVESDIARAVAETLQAKLTGTAEHVLASRPTEHGSLSALPKAVLGTGGCRENITALGFFQLTINRDPATRWPGPEWPTPIRSCRSMQTIRRERTSDALLQPREKRWS